MYSSVRGIFSVFFSLFIYIYISSRCLSSSTNSYRLVAVEPLEEGLSPFRSSSEAVHLVSSSTGNRTETSSVSILCLRLGRARYCRAPTQHTQAEFKDICHVFSRPDLVPTRSRRTDINYTSYTTVSFKFGSPRIIHDKNNNFSFNIGSVALYVLLSIYLRQQIKIKRVGEARFHEISIKISISLEGIEKKE